MPSKLRKAIGAVKDQTSISLAKVTNAANLEVTILKATTHDKNPIEERYVNEIVNIVSSNKAYAAACAQCIGKRIGKTRNWVVALKSLMIVLRIFQDGDPYFPREVFHAMKRGAKILNLSSFKDDSNSSPWDYTAFIRTFALYLDERLDCFLTGKLQRRFNYNNQFLEKNQKNKLSNEPGIRDMKPTMVLARITYWQKLLDRAIGTRPTGSAKNNRLVQISLYAIVQESFDLYKDISDGLAVVLDNFFNLPLSACVTAFNACVKSHKQFDELSGFYSFCANIGVGRSYEYPTIQKVSEELMETLQAFLKDQASLPTNNGSNSNSNSKRFIVNTPKDSAACSSSSQDEGIERRIERCSTLEKLFETGSEFGSQCTSLEDLMSAMSPVESLEQDTYSDEQSDEDDKQSRSDDFVSANGSGSSRSLTVDQTARSSLEITTFDDIQHEVHQTNELEQQNTTGGCSNNDNSKDCWELVLAKTVTASNETSPNLINGNDPFVNLFDEASVSQDKYNPFLEDTETLALALPSTTNADNFKDVFDLSLSPTFNANDTTVALTFNAQDPLASTFSNQNSNSMTNLDLLFGEINAIDTTIAPTFRAQDSLETNLTLPLSPTFHTQTSDNMIIVAPSFQTQSSFKNVSPTVQWHNSIEEPNHIVQNFDTCIVPYHFQSESFYNSTVAPTFSVKDCNELTLATPIKDDPFGPWPSAVNNDQMLNVSMQEQNLLRQQQLWLEQQNKIIAKYIG